MTGDEISRVYIPHLKTQFEQGRPLLLTGAGFSASAKNIEGKNLPTGRQLKEILWPICFPASSFDPDTSLQDLYQYAATRHASALKEVLTRALSVDHESLPAWYSTYFSLPWARVYTLNIDDLDLAAARMFDLPRKINSVSALSSEAGVVGQPGHLDVIHINGLLADIPDGVTFSTTQYAQRLAGVEPIYRRLTAELLTSPCVFVGTALDEPPLWQHIEMRRMRGAGHNQREFRPRSYLVAQSLSPARQALLAEFNVVWIPMSAEEFKNSVLNQLGEASRNGLARLSEEAGFTLKGKTVPDIAELALSPYQGTEYLLGQQPIWSDIQSGRAVQRDDDETLWQLVEQRLSVDGLRGIVTISGTAGSGKSTALTKVGLKLAARGQSVSWVSPEGDYSPKDIRTSTKHLTGRHVIASN